MDLWLTGRQVGRHAEERPVHVGNVDFAEMALQALIHLVAAGQ